MLKGRLDLYSDEWRTAQPETQFKGEMPTLIPAAVRVPRKYKVRKNKLDAALNLTDGVNVPLSVGNEAGPSVIRTEKPEKPSKAAARAERERKKAAKAEMLKAEKGKRKRAKAEKVIRFKVYIKFRNMLIVTVFRKKIQMHRSVRQIRSFSSVRSSDRY